MVSSSSFEHVHASDEAARPTTTPFQREFNSPLLVAQAAVNRVPKPPRHSLERGVRAPTTANDCDADGSDGGCGGVADDAVAVHSRVETDAGEEVAPLMPKTPVPRDDKSIEFAKTNVS